MAMEGLSKLVSEEHEDHIHIRWPTSKFVGSLRLLCVSDTHDQHAFMPRGLPQADILIHAGDFTFRGAKEELESFREWMHTLLANGTVKDVVFVAGNHEVSLELSAKNPAVRRAQEANKTELINQPNMHYLEDSGCIVQGIRFYGSPYCTRFGRDWGFQASDVPEDLGKRYNGILEGLHVLVTHQPPFGQGDKNTVDKRTGSHMLLERVLTASPLLHVFGHIHTGHGVSMRDDVATLFVNAAICDEDYNPVQKPILVELVGDATASA